MHVNHNISARHAAHVALAAPYSRISDRGVNVGPVEENVAQPLRLPPQRPISRRRRVSKVGENEFRDSSGTSETEPAAIEHDALAAQRRGRGLPYPPGGLLRDPSQDYAPPVTSGRRARRPMRRPRANSLTRLGSQRS